jgi:plasmid stabilization system protein ParE
VKVTYTAEGASRADFVDDWWRGNRPSAPDLFREELDGALEQILAMPESGTRCATSRGMAIYRVLLGETRQALYYSFDRDRDVLVVHSIWGTQRGRPPRL